MIYDYVEDHYNTLKARQNELTKNNDTLKESILLNSGFPLAVLREDGRPWMHDTIWSIATKITLAGHIKCTLQKQDE